MKKLLFLDVDGVLNYADWGVKHGLVPVPSPYQPSIDDLVKWIDPDRVKLVNEIVDRTYCAIVLSSSTRSDPRMSAVLAKAGLEQVIFDTTPSLLWKVDSGGNVVGVTTRADEVYESLCNHQPDTFCVLDDMDAEWERIERWMLTGSYIKLGRVRAWYHTRPEPVPVREFLVKTEFATGLLREHVERAVAILNRNDRRV